MWFIVNGTYLLFLNTIQFVFGNILGIEKMDEDPLAHRHRADDPLFWIDFVMQYSGHIILGFIIWKSYKIAFSPLNRVKTLTDVGWGTLGQKKSGKREIANRIREIQRMRGKNDLPPVYPNGWFVVAESREVSKGQVKNVECLGETFAVFRREDGVISILNAYCPHLGANMAIGGAVRGNCLECPFHGWRFDGQTGKCSEIPYAKKVPEFAKVRHWPSDECNGFIFVWYDAEGRSPCWKVPVLEDIQNGQYFYRGRTEHEVLAHIQEIPENGSDLAHLGHLHVPNIMKGADLNNIFTEHKLYDLMQHEWEGEWKSQESPNAHVAEVNINHSFPFFGGKLKISDVTVKAQQIGPGLVHLHFDTYFGKGVLLQTVTPLEPLKQKLLHNFYSSSTYVAPLAKLTLLAEANQVERDIMIWNNKQFPSKPGFVAEDKLILKFRRWYSQFYSENSPKFTGFSKNTLDW